MYMLWRILVGLILLGVALHALYSGRMTLRGGTVVQRSENPLGYWLLVLLYLGLGVAVVVFRGFLH